MCETILAAIVAAGYDPKDCFVVGEFADVFRESEVPLPSTYWETSKSSDRIHVLVKERTKKESGHCAAITYHRDHNLINLTFAKTTMDAELEEFNGLQFPTMEYQADHLHYPRAVEFMKQYRTYGVALNKEEQALLALVERVVEWQKNLKMAKLLLQETLDDSRPSAQTFFNEHLRGLIE